MTTTTYPAVVRIDSLDDGTYCCVPDAREWDARRGAYDVLRGWRMRKLKHNDCRARVRVYVGVADGAGFGTYCLDIAGATLVNVIPNFTGLTDGNGTAVD